MLDPKLPPPNEEFQTLWFIRTGRAMLPCNHCSQTGWFYNWEYRPDEITDGKRGAPCQVCNGRGWN